MVPSRLTAALLLAAAPGAATAAGASAPTRPNILFILSDDHAAHAIGAYGSKINRTPHIDRLAAEGLRFANCFAVNSICTPSRASILTGKYSHRNGVPVFNRFDGSQMTFPKLLQAAGYHTGVVGKWHLESDPTGFDYWNVLPGQGDYFDPKLIEMGGEKTVKGYATEIITDLAIAFLERRPAEQPFLLLCHHKAPHRDWQPGPGQAGLYEDEDIPEPETFNDDYRGRSTAAAEATMRIARHLTRGDLKQDPPPGLAGQALKKWKYQRYIKDYLRCVAGVDDSVGKLLDYLEARGLKENTLVIYSSDQGFFLGDHGWYDKRFMYEESIRMPLLVRLPGLIRPGAVSERMVLNVDFAPTLLELAGLAIPPEVQGRSFVPLLRGEEPADWRRSMYYRYYHYPQHHRVEPHLGVRTERWKLIHFNRIDEWELYDLANDPRELKNLHADPAHAATVKELAAELERLRRELGDEDQFAGGVPSPAALKRAADPRPNVIVILADDLGWGDLGCYGHPRFRTPHLDRMAKEGARLTDFYAAAPYCAPSRAALLTGRHPFRSGMTRNPAPDAGIDDAGLPASELTLAEAFRGAGYRTGAIGKWHLGHRPQFLPTRHGFDEYFGILYSNDMRPVELVEGEKVVEYPVAQAALTRRYTQRALAFLEKHREQPFFLYLAHAMPHKPLAASEDFYGKSGAGLYGDAVSELDWSAGEVLVKLKDLELDERTLVIFTSDNGPWYGGSTGGLRGMKATSWEGGLRVPFIARWPGKIPAGRVSHQPASLIDGFATTLAAAGIAAPADRIIDGKDILPVLAADAPSPHQAIFAFHGGRVSAVRGGRWKLCAGPRGQARVLVPGQKWTDPRAPDGVTILAPFEQAHPSQYPGSLEGDDPEGFALYDLEADPAERHDVATSHPDVVERLRGFEAEMQRQADEAAAVRAGAGRDREDSPRRH